METLNTENSILNIFPNPFQGYTNIEYILENASSIKAEVYDLVGRKVATLAEGEQSSGKHNLRFETSVSGTYILRIKIGEEVVYRKIESLK